MEQKDKIKDEEPFENQPSWDGLIKLSLQT